MKWAGTFAALALMGCESEVGDTSNAAIANRAESLERGADATTDQLIAEIEAQANADMAVEAIDLNSQNVAE